MIFPHLTFSLKTKTNIYLYKSTYIVYLYIHIIALSSLSISTHTRTHTHTKNKGSTEGKIGSNPRTQGVTDKWPACKLTGFSFPVSSSRRVLLPTPLGPTIQTRDRKKTCQVCMESYKAFQGELLSCPWSILLKFTVNDAVTDWMGKTFPFSYSLAPHAFSRYMDVKLLLQV